MRQRYNFKPIGMFGVSAALPDLYMPSQVCIVDKNDTTNCTKNMRSFQGAIEKRWGFVTGLSDCGIITDVIRFTSKDGSDDKTLFFSYYSSGTQADLCLVNDAGTGYTYLTKTHTFTTTAQVDEIDAATKKVVTFEGGATLQTDGITGGYFILDEDQAATEPDSSWTKIASVDSETQLTLSTAYENAITSPGAKDAKIRVQFTESGQFPIGTTGGYRGFDWAIVDDKLCYTTSGGGYVRYYTFDNDYEDILDATEAVNFYYCIEFANRLILANYNYTGEEDPLQIKWSKENDPTDWTDSTAGNSTIQTSEKEITGLAKAAGNLIVFTPNSIVLGYRTGISTSPIAFQDEIKGAGCWAPRSIVHAAGTVFFMGANNFYKLQGSVAVPIGDAVKDELFGSKNYTLEQLESFQGIHNIQCGEIWWFQGNTQLIYAYDYIRNGWNFYDTSAVGATIYLYGGGNSIGTSTDLNTYFYLGASTADAVTTNKLLKQTSSTYADATVAMVSQILTKKTDFSDQNQDALGRWKTIYKVRVLYKDLNTDMPLTLSIRKDGGAFAAIATNTVGTASESIKYTDYHTISTGNIFDFKVSMSSAAKTTQIVGIEAEYELGGSYYTL